MIRVADALFGPTTTPPERLGLRWTARYVGLAAVLALIVFARRPDSILRAEFCAEDGNVFFYQQRTLGFWSALLTLYGGFPFLGQRLVAALWSGVPTAEVPLAHNASAIAITALGMATFSLPRFRHLIRSDGLRAAFCLAAVCIPAGQELLATPTTVGYFLAVWLVFLSLVRTPRTSTGVILWCLGGMLAVCSTQLAVLTVPFWLLRTARGVSRRHGPDVVFGATQIATLLLVIGMAGGMTGMAGLSGRGAELMNGIPIFEWHARNLWSAFRALGWVAAWCVDSALLPAAALERLAALRRLPVGAVAVLAIVSVALAFRELSERGRVTVCLAFYLFLSSLYLVVAGRPIISLVLEGAVQGVAPDTARALLGPRHRALPNIALLLAGAGIIDGAGRVRPRLVGAVACAAMLLAWTREFRVPPFPDLQWPLWATRLDQKLASGTGEPLVIPSYPPSFEIIVDTSPSAALRGHRGRD